MYEIDNGVLSLDLFALEPLTKHYSCFIRKQTNMSKLTVIAFLHLTLIITNAQKSTYNKPYEQWTLDESWRVLTKSPWAQIDAEAGRTSEISYFLEVRLYSALPVRQAIVRRMQLTIPYDKLTREQKADYDAEVDGLLKCPQCDNHYIVTLFSTVRDPLELSTTSNQFPPRPMKEVVDVVAILKRFPRDELLRHVSLTNDKGERRASVNVSFTAKRNEIVFLFPRFDDQGQPLLTEANKKFTFDIALDVFKKEGNELHKTTFEVGKLVQNGQVIF